MKTYKPISDREVARRLGVRSIYTAYYYLQTIQEIYDAGLIICERVSTNEPQREWINKKYNDIRYYECEKCHGEVHTNCYYYCPWCGARMKGADDEQVYKEKLSDGGSIG